MKRKTVVILIIIASAVVVIGFFGMMFLAAFMGEFDGAEFSGFGDKVAVVDLFGQITDSRDFVRQVKRWTDDESVKAIVVHIDSPGGGVAASQEMYNEVMKARAEGKLVIASMGSVAASGGYYVACGCDKIVANPGTLTGSIGVIMSFPMLKDLFDKIGIQFETIKSGELKDVGSMNRPMTAEEERMLKAVIDDTYEQFVEAVAEGRDRDKEDIYPLADGSVFTGRQAYNLGLVDTLGSYEDAVAMAGEMTNLGSDPKIVKERKRKASFFDLLGGVTKLLERVNEIESQNYQGLMYIYH